MHPSRRLPDYRVEADDSAATATARRLTVCFFPEGGHLVEGLRQRVAFEVLDGEGRSHDATALLQDGDSTLCAVSTLREGRGVMPCTPRSGHRLSLVLSDDKGKPHHFALPDAEENGVSLHLEDIPNQTTLDPFPFLLEDVKSLYIAEDNAAWRDFGRSDMLQLYNPVSIFVYLHRTFNVKNKGVRKTHFQAYDRPARYEMPDYSVLPREEDFRRTLFDRRQWPCHH
ncbi:MAG: hypothetical protein IJ243_10090 [Prevotella sp.]|nr:hypothetical protein [Prevotella sp.]